MLVFMIYTHIAQRYDFYKTNYTQALLYLFGCFMPWFFFKGGMFFKKEIEFKIYCLNSIRRLLYPYILWSIVGTITYIIYKYVQSGFCDLGKVLSDFVFVFFFNGSVEGNLPLWFLFSLFFVRILHHFFSIYINRKELLAFLLFVIAYYLSAIGFARPMWIGNICLGWCFFCLGDILKDIQFKRNLFYCAILIFVTIEILEFSMVGFRSNKLICGNYIFWFFEALCGIIIFNNVFLLLEKHTPFSSSSFASCMAFIGKKTMTVYVTHWPILYIVDVVLKKYI